MTQTHRNSLLGAVALLLSASLPLSAYHHFYLTAAGTGGPVKWRTLGIVITADSAPASVLTDVTTATTTWNNIASAQNPFATPVASAVDFTGANKGTAWGMLTADGKQEIVWDTDGTALQAFGLDPASVNGYGPSRKEMVGGLPAITDAFLIVNAQRANFDKLSTVVHELGHILGLAHSTVGMNHSGQPNAGASLDPIAVDSVPTMHPFSLGTANTSRRTPEADDIAGLSELYPEATFTTGFGVISGRVNRCITDEVLEGVNVRIVNTSSTTVQLSRFTGFDGTAPGAYTIRGVPVGNYRVIVEPMGSNGFTLNRFGSPPTKTDNDFPTEYLSPTVAEDGCTEEVPDLATAVAVPVTAAGTFADRNLKVSPVTLAFVVDDTGSMGEEISAVRASLTTTINQLKAGGRTFPRTALVTFKDNVTRRVITADPVRLQAVVDTLSASGGGDCQEAGNAALLAAGDLLARSAKVLFFTDADSRSDGPARSTVTDYYRSKSIRMSVLLSGTCSGDFTGADTAADRMAPLSNSEIERLQGPPQQSTDVAKLVRSSGLLRRSSSTVADEYPNPPQLGVESAIRTFSEIAADTGGFFAAVPEINSGSAIRYQNIATNLAISSVLPTIALVTPGRIPAGTTQQVELYGSNTNFTGTTVVTVGGTGLTVSGVQVVSPTFLRVTVAVAAGTAASFRDVTATTLLSAVFTETATGTGALQTVAATTFATVVGVSPATGSPGQTMNVTITGQNTAFVNGTSVASFGLGVTVNSLTVTSPTTAVANITIAGAATIGFRAVEVRTGAQIANDLDTSGSFRVSAAAAVVASIASINPVTGITGATLNLIVVGSNTNFLAGVTQVSLSGTGITVNAVTVSSTTSLTANVTIAAGAALGFRDVVTTTGSEVASIINGFQIIAPSVCSYTITQNSITTAEDGTTGTIGLTANGINCQWTSATADRWMTAFPISGTGNATINFTILPNFRPVARTSTITIAGLPIAVTQSAGAGAQSRRYVRLLYYFYFGRIPSEAEVNFQAGSGLAMPVLAQNFFNSEEFNVLGRFISGLYVGILARDAEYGGWVFQRNALGNNLKTTALFAAQDVFVGNFLNSLEYQAKFGNPAADEYVRLLYRNVLFREAIASEVLFQNSLGLSRVALARNLLNSGEFRAGANTRLTAFLIYATLLQRDASVGELAAVSNLVRTGSLVSVLEGFINSPEFLANLN